MLREPRREQRHLLAVARRRPRRVAVEQELHAACDLADEAPEVGAPRSRAPSGCSSQCSAPTLRLTISSQPAAHASTTARPNGSTVVGRKTKRSVAARGSRHVLGRDRALGAGCARDCGGSNGSDAPEVDGLVLLRPLERLQQPLAGVHRRAEPAGAARPLLALARGSARGRSRAGSGALSPATRCGKRSRCSGEVKTLVACSAAQRYERRLAGAARRGRGRASSGATGLPASASTVSARIGDAVVDADDVAAGERLERRRAGTSTTSTPAGAAARNSACVSSAPPGGSNESASHADLHAATCLERAQPLRRDRLASSGAPSTSRLRAGRRRPRAAAGRRRGAGSCARRRPGRPRGSRSRRPRRRG